MKTIRVKIEAVDDEGRGRGIFEDQDIAVRGAFVGDDVEMRPERRFAARDLIVGRAERFFARGPCHTERICPHPSPCPACPLHGVDDSLATEIKRGRIEQALTDAGLDYEVEDLVQHPNQFGYRQKVKLMAQIVDRKLRLGVYVPYSHDFVVAELCPYVNPVINKAIVDLLEVLNASTLDLAQIKAVILRAGRDGVSAVFVLKQAINLQPIFNHCLENKILLSACTRVQTEETNSILGGERGFSMGPDLIAPLEGGPLVDPDSFCQSDPEQATFMYDFVAEFLTTVSCEGWFVDAYAGVGGFTRALQRRGVLNVIAIEQSPTALSALETLGVKVLLTPMSEALKTLRGSKPFAGMVVDPAKKGLMQDAQAIAELRAPKVALVSCDPGAMASDLTVFLQHGYKVERIVPVDLFGGTPAVETIVLLVHQETLIIDCLRKDYQLEVQSLSFLPLGADANTSVFRAALSDGTQYFVKLRHGDFNEMSLIVPKMLHEQFDSHIIAPLTTTSGKLWVQVNGIYLSVYPFVSGRDASETGLTDAQWIAFGKTLKGIHTATLAPEISARIPTEDFSEQWRERVRNFLKEVDGTTFVDPVSMGLADLLKRKRSAVETLLQRAEQLGAVLQSRRPELVLCHADVHAWNMLIQPDGNFYIVDWDTVILAPKERDLMFVASGMFARVRSPEQEEALFYQGYGDQEQVDPTGLAYYRCERIVRDIAEYCDSIFLTENGEGRAEGLRQLASQFEPGNVVDLALRSRSSKE